MSEPLEVEVPALLDGVRLDRGVAMLADVSRRAAAELITRGEVAVDGVVVNVVREALRQGSVITIALSTDTQAVVGAEPEVAFDVVFSDDAVIVIDKPAGLVVHPGAGNHDGTLVGGLLARFPDLAELSAVGVCSPERPGIVHRLDKGTSGLMVVARTQEAYGALVAQLADRSVARRYLALLEGTVGDDRGEVDAPIGRSARTPTKMAISSSGRPARTAYTVRERRHRPRDLTLVELSLHSGRTHQIRVHMAAIGHPVVGDARYGAPERDLGAGRFFLHAYALAFDHPTSHERVEFSAALPDDLANFLERTAD